MYSCVPRNIWIKVLVSCALLAIVSPISAQTATPEQEYSRYLTPAQTVSPFSSFGDQVSLRNGGLVFSNTDVELPGIGPTIRITRTMDIVGRIAARPETSGYRFGDWELELPRLKTLVNTNASVSAGGSVLWQVSGSNARCSNFSDPGIIAFGRNGYDAVPDQWWGGYQLVDASGQSRNVLGAAVTVPGSPAHVAVTSDNWIIGCLPSTSNGQPGEAFLATSPDGTRYWLDRLVYVAGDRVGANGQPGINRSYASMLVTRIEDRFGNWVTYQYVTGGINIDASDGRHVGIIFTASGGTVTVGSGSTARTWQYGVTSGSLTAVTLPDGSSWQYNLGALYSLPWINNHTGNCTTAAPTDGISGVQTVGTVTSPSGATATYTVGTLHIGRSYVPKDCEPLLIGGDPSVLFAYLPKDSWTYALLKKTVSGPGITTATWNYSYSPGYASWASDCAGGCTSSVWTDVTDPDGTRHRSIFSNKYGETENLLLRQETYAAGAGAPMYAVDYIYATFPWTSTSNPYPWPAVIGYDETPRSNTAISGRWTPILSATVTQDGVTFNSAVNSYDAYARPLSVHKWSSLGYSRNDATEYYDDATHWVLGQVARHYNVESGLVDARTVYDPSTALPLQAYAFEKLKATMTYNADGTLATRKDGLNHTTTYSNWKRGIPQAIQYADGTSVSAIVNDNGWITAVTDENGYATGYGYDAMGRIAAISYPSETTFNYNTTTLTFAPSSAAAYGLPAGHWEQVTQTGNRKKVVAFDGLWRPVVEQEEDIGASSATLHWLAKRYDSNGRLIFQSYPINPYVSGWKNFTDSLAGINTTYDALDRVTQVQQDSEFGPLTTTTEYLTGFQVRTTNPRGYQTTNGYQVYDQPSYEQLAWSAQPERKDVAITRNYVGLPLTITQADHANAGISVTRSYAYDGYMQLCKTLEPETGATLMDYDAAGNLAWTASGLRGGDYDTASECPNSRSAAYGSGRRVDRSYDARNRLLTLAFPDGVGNQNWQYTPDGLPLQITTYNSAGNGTPVVNGYSYNHRRLLAGETSAQPGWYSWSIGYGYDANASLAANSYPDGFSVIYTNNALGQPTQVTSSQGTLASGIGYYPNGAISQFTYGNGIVHTMTQNARQLPARSLDSGGVLNDVYNYDASGNVNSIIDELVGAGNYSVNSRWMTYDGLDRLTGAGSGSFGGTDNWHRFTYDALDNLTSWKLAGVKDYASYLYDASNRLTNIQNSAGASVVALAYDAQGNLANKNGQAYAFDYGNRLRNVPGLESYSYDDLGRRVLQAPPTGGNIVSMYTSAGQLMFQQDGRRNVNIPQVYLGGSVLARWEYDLTTHVGQLKYAHTDALGSPVAITNQAGQVIERTQYEPYGAVIGKPNNDRIGYTGHVMDSATGLTYMQQRYYDPIIGRFLSTDPVQALGGRFSRYDYANNNPYKFNDPDGRVANTPQPNSGSGGCDIECKRAREEERRRQGDAPYSPSITTYSPSNAQQRYDAANKELQNIMPLLADKRTESSDGAAAYFAYLAQPISTKFALELYASIVHGRDGWRIDHPFVSNLFDYKTGLGSAVDRAPGPGEVAIHTHPNNSYGNYWHSPFSYEDVQARGRFYVSLPNGSLYVHDPFHPKDIFEIPMK